MAEGARLGELVTGNCQGMTGHCSYSYPPTHLSQFSNVENPIKAFFGAFVSSQATNREFHTHLSLVWNLR